MRLIYLHVKIPASNRLSAMMDSLKGCVDLDRSSKANESNKRMKLSPNKRTYGLPEQETRLTAPLKNLVPIFTYTLDCTLLVTYSHVVDQCC